MSMDIGKDLQNAYEEGYKQGRYDEKVETEMSLPKWTCTANFVAEQLERLKDMTDEERLKLLQTLFPSADRPQGAWVHDGSQWANRWVCDKCGHKIFEPQTNFCPNCGADMRGEEE